jgi:hypothetical protein
VKVYTSHVKPGAVPVLVPEGFSWGAAIFGWIWLLFQRAWIAAALLFAAFVIVLTLSPHVSGFALLVGQFLLQGLFGRDLVRWSLAHSGYEPGPVVAAQDHDAALARLLTEQPDLLADLGGALA